MSEKKVEEDQKKTDSEVSSQKDGSNKEDDGNNSQDASKGKSNEEGSIRSNVPGESVIGNQEPNEVLNKSQQEKPEEQTESSLILNVQQAENLNAAEEEDAGDGNPGGDEDDDKSEQDNKSEERASIAKDQQKNQEPERDPQEIAEELAKKYPDLANHVSDPKIQRILLTEEEAVKMNVTRQYIENIMQGEILKQQVKTEEVDGVLVYNVMPYTVLVELTQNFFDMM